MVKFEDYWEKIVSANPALGRGDSRITLSSVSFKRELRKAFEAGKDFDIDKDSFGDLFRGIFDK
jgi:hypothetical protein